METKVRGSLKEADIRPDGLAEEMKLATKLDLEWLLQQKYTNVACPACASIYTTDNRIIKNKLIYVECSHCSTIYMNPRPTPEALREFSIQSHNYRYWNEHIFPASEAVRREKIFRPRAQYINKMARFNTTNKPVTLMDIGAGFGTFCEEFKKVCDFKHVIAVEPVPSLAETCRVRGLEVIESSFEQLERDPRTVDVITAFEVLEHIFDPEEFVDHCYHLLNEGGLLVITSPNIKGFETQVLGDKSSTISYEHFNYFHTSSLCLLLRRFGFEIIEITTPGELDVDIVRRNIEDTNVCPFLKYLIMDEQIDFQKFLATNMLSSHMRVVARKRGGYND